MPATFSDEAFVTLVTPMINAINASGQATTTALAGGSFPFSLSKFPQGNSDIPRREWAIWQKLRAAPGGKDLVFGDYAVTNPKLLVIPPGAKIPALAQIRYALVDKWKLQRAALVKGKAGFQQYKQLCALVLKAPYYAGPAYSFGDGRIDHHADPLTTSGSPQTWRRDATNHHLVQTLRQLGLSAPAVPTKPVAI